MQQGNNQQLEGMKLFYYSFNWKFSMVMIIMWWEVEEPKDWDNSSSANNKQGGDTTYNNGEMPTQQQFWSQCIPNYESKWILPPPMDHLHLPCPPCLLLSLKWNCQLCPPLQENVLLLYLAPKTVLHIQQHLGGLPSTQTPHLLQKNEVCSLIGLHTT